MTWVSWTLIGMCFTGVGAAAWMMWITKLAGDRASEKMQKEIAIRRAEYAEREADIHAAPARDKPSVIEQLRRHDHN